MYGYLQWGACGSPLFSSSSVTILLKMTYKALASEQLFTDTILWVLLFEALVTQ